MKIDMHCHVGEGSIDSHVSLEEYINILKSRGYDGMLVTDHDTYNGYRKWKYDLCNTCKDFVVLKGIEYDTKDGGHFICIMPSGTKMRLMENRGLHLVDLIEFVHGHGGILGPAHPYGAKYQSFATTKVFKKNANLTKEFDFIETFNACESAISNKKAAKLARVYNLPGIGGSDAHKPKAVGLGYTKILKSVSDEDEFIEYIKGAAPVLADGEYYGETLKDRVGKIGHIIDAGFWIYNRSGTLFQNRKRKKNIVKEKPNENIMKIKKTTFSDAAKKR
ncbi:MAG: PHP domain-containing protein [Lachnospiraceae bacterium]|jgi:predicted metal-dependent phosphoesterase TrpH|nr:PHP domain-containing protein [Lachnospiraceae bacterium]